MTAAGSMFGLGQLEPSGFLADALGNSRIGPAGFFGVEFIRRSTPMVARVMLFLSCGSQGAQV